MKAAHNAQEYQTNRDLRDYIDKLLANLNAAQKKTRAAKKELRAVKKACWQYAGRK